MKRYISHYFFSLFIIICSHTVFSQYNYYFGTLHSHSSYSDGNKDSTTTNVTLPSDNYSFAKNSSHFDFLGISEHNHAGAGMYKPNYKKGIQQANIANDENNFITLYGMEWGVISTGGHAIVYGIDSLVGWESNNYDIYNSKTNYRDLFQKIANRTNAFAWLAHPDFGDYNNLAYSAYDSVADKAIVGMALRSGPAFSTNITYSNPDNSWPYEDYYKLILSNGYHLGAGIDHDNHYLTFGRHTPARTVVFGDSLTKNKLVKSVQDMHFYASDDWNCKVKFEIDYKPMGSIITKAGNPTLYLNVDDEDLEQVDSIRIVYGVPGSQQAPQVIKLFNKSTVVYTHYIQNLESFYYYAVITQADGDKIWTSPLWYTRNDNVTTSVNNYASNLNNNLTVYQNPEGLSILISEITPNEMLTLTSITGQVISTFIPCNDVIQLPVVNLAKGVYVVRYGESVKKIVIEK